MSLSGASISERKKYETILGHYTKLSTAYKLSYEGVSLILQKCTKSKSSKLCKQIHGMLITNEINMTIMSLDAKILGVYASCGDIRYAHQLFDKMPQPNVFAFNWMISVMGFHGYFHEAIGYFSLMQKVGTLPNKYTFSVVLKACIGLLDLNKGKEVHGVMGKMGFVNDVLCCNGLLDMYCKCGKLEYARRVFDRMLSNDVASWTSMICGYSNLGKLNEAIGFLDRMKHEGLEPNEFTWNALINGFARNGDRDGALEIVYRMTSRGFCHDLVTWNALISGFARSKLPFEALNLFREMLIAGIRPNHVTLTGVLPVCGLIGSSQRGRELHGLIYRLSLEVNVYVASALIDMYSKSGGVKAARNVFEMTHVRNVPLWNVIIGCLGKHGAVRESIELFEEMQRLGFQPNEVTLVSVLSACSHGGLVETGMKIFKSMKEKFKVEANKEHYACVVDLLCRAGEVEEAYDLIKRMPIEPTESIVGAFVNGCKMHGRRDLAEKMYDSVLKVASQESGTLVTLCNLLAAEEEWQEVHNVRKLMKGQGVYKNPGFSLLDRRKETLEFKGV